MKVSCEPDGPITDEIRGLIETQRLCYVATVGPDATPNLSPKGSLKVLDDRHVAFADMASPQTVANLRSNPFLEINVVDPFLRRGCRIKGRAQILDDPELLSAVGDGLGHEYPVRAAVHITVTDARSVDSPVYLFTDAAPEDVRSMWEDLYGYRATRSQGPTPHAAAPTAGDDDLGEVLPGLPGLLGIRPRHLDAHRVEATLTVTESHLAPNGYLHAASAVGLADTACGYGCKAALPPGAVGFTTIELKSNHLGTARPGEVICCTAAPAHLGRTTQVWDAVVTVAGAPRPITMFRCTQLVLYPEDPGPSGAASEGRTVAP